ncbi:MAG: hypothetical protein M1835_001862 [Candelina submexicana]|nr:MAG: hypothetical protein M1835_001862 [Candelina submexicana]
MPLPPLLLAAVTAYAQNSQLLVACGLLLMLHEDYAVHGVRFRLRDYPEPCTYDPTKHFNMDDFSEPNFVNHFRFTKLEFLALLPCLRLEHAVLRNHYKATERERLALVLYHITFPRRLNDMLELFGHSSSWISSVATDVVEYLAAR